MLRRPAFRRVHCVVAFRIKNPLKTCYPSTRFLAGATAAIFPQCPVLRLLACLRQPQGCRPCRTGTAAPVSAIFSFVSPLAALATSRGCFCIVHSGSCRSFPRCTQRKTFLEMLDPTARLKPEDFLKICPAFRGFLSACHISSFRPPIRSPAVLYLRCISHYPQL